MGIAVKMAMKDLIPFNKRSKDEVKELNRKGGINSGKARRQKKLELKTAQQIVQAFFNEEKELATGKKLTNKEFMLLNAIKRTVNSITADNGHKRPLQSEDLRAVEYFLSLVGEAPVIKTATELSVSSPIQIIDDVDNNRELDKKEDKK